MFQDLYFLPSTLSYFCPKVKVQTGATIIVLLSRSRGHLREGHFLTFFRRQCGHSVCSILNPSLAISYILILNSSMFGQLSSRIARTTATADSSLVPQLYNRQMIKLSPIRKKLFLRYLLKQRSNFKFPLNGQVFLPIFFKTICIYFFSKFLNC